MHRSQPFMLFQCYFFLFFCRHSVVSLFLESNFLSAPVSFFDILKSELLYLRPFQPLNEFYPELVAYFEYYNHNWMKAK